MTIEFEVRSVWDFRLEGAQIVFLLIRNTSYSFSSFIKILTLQRTFQYVSSMLQRCR